MLNLEIYSENVISYTAKVKKPQNSRATHVELHDDDIVQAARDILRRRAEKRDKSFKITSPRTAVSAFEPIFFGADDRERFAVAFLDSQHRPITVDCLFEGTINAAAVYPREIVKAALRYNAAAVIIAHNHPSGETNPSDADRRITQRIKEALSTVDINLLDHFIFSAEMDSFSFAERGLV